LSGREDGRNGEVEGRLEAYYGLIRRLIKALETARLDYAFTGALAASFYGVPRTTTDVDVIVGVTVQSERRRLVSAFKQIGLIVDQRAVDQALSSGYNIATFKDIRTAYSVDTIFSTKRLEKRTGTVAGAKTFFQSPEELILSKLRMIKSTVPRKRAVKDEEDVKAILRFTEVDMEKVRQEARIQHTLPVLEAIAAKKKHARVEADTCAESK
jgi:hypothetical protein